MTIPKKFNPNQMQYSANEVETVVCPFCKSDDSRTIVRERTSLEVVICRKCGLIYVSPRLKSPEKIYWGDGSGYYEEAKLVFSGEVPHHRDQNYLSDLKLIKKFKPRGDFLDVGTNAGFFLRMAKMNKQWNIQGVEPSKPLAELASKYFDLNITNAFLEDAAIMDDSFDIVTMTDVFEHVSQPQKILAKVHKILRPGGVIFIKVPNGLFNLTKMLLAKWTGNTKNYDIFDSYEHVIHYSHRTLGDMLKSSGFDIVYRGIGRPIHTPVWQRYTGKYFQYPSPWVLDIKNHVLREVFYGLGFLEYLARGFSAGFLAPNIIILARKKAK